MSRWLRTLPALVLTAFLVVPTPGSAGSAESVDGADEILAAERLQWRSEVNDARDDVEAAYERQRKALAAYENMRHRRKKRGAAKRAILDELANAEAEIPKAEERYQTLLEAARTAGVPPGWLRDLRPPSPAAPADPAD
jgi:chromosome segregation ATPase